MDCQQPNQPSEKAAAAPLPAAAALRQCALELGEAANLLRPALPRVAQLYDAAAERAGKAAEAAALPVVLVAPPLTEADKRELADALQRGGGAVILDRAPAMTLERFVNALRILKSIDLHELQAVGLFKEATKLGLKNTDAAARDRAAFAWDHWESFRDDPLRYMIVCDDEAVAKIWAVIESRQPKEDEHGKR